MKGTSYWKKALDELHLVRVFLAAKEFDLAKFHTAAAEGFTQKAIAHGEKLEGAEE